MKISKYYKLGKSQYELDFVDINTNKDLPLFIDPYFLSIRLDRWSIEASRTIKSFFEEFIRLVRTNNINDAKELFDHLGEPNETCLGLSKRRPRGRGIGNKLARDIFKSLIKSKAVQEGIVEDIEDCRIFVEGVDKDMVSDMATNIIKKQLIEYTQAQCNLWKIPLQTGVSTGYVWDRINNRWNSYHEPMLIVNGKKILLVPKAIVSYSQKYTAQQYHQHFVLNYLQNEHLELNSVLVQRHKRKDGTERVFVTKKSIVEHDAPLTKEFLLNFTKKHPDVFKSFRENVIERVGSIDDVEIADVDLKEVICHLIKELKSIPPGNDGATKYHKTVVGIIELLFYPNLFSPQVEKEIHQGRKRIDITFDNGAKDGFFHRLHSVHKIPSPYIFIECKNYTRDVANPELDQLSGRYSPNRGRFGFIVCRSVDDIDGLIKKCADTYRDDRGAILPLVDSDLLALLVQLGKGVKHPEETLLSDRLRQIVLS